MTEFEKGEKSDNVTLVAMQSPSEKDDLELEASNDYGTKDTVVNEDHDTGITVERQESQSSERGDDDFLEAEQLGMKEKLLIRLFPWVLKWPWFRKRLYKKKETDKCQ